MSFTAEFQYIGWANTPLNNHDLNNWKDIIPWLNWVFTELLRQSDYLKYPNLLKNPNNVIDTEIPDPALEIQQSNANDLLVSREWDVIYVNVWAIANKPQYIPYIRWWVVMVLLLNELIKYYQTFDPKLGKDVWVHLELLSSRFFITPTMLIEAIPLMTHEESARDNAIRILNQFLDNSWVEK